jgi:hypothetical protein
MGDFLGGFHVWNVSYVRLPAKNEDWPEMHVHCSSADRSFPAHPDHYAHDGTEDQGGGITGAGESLLVGAVR